MKPIQFAQNKKDLKWKSMVVTENISPIHYTLRTIKHNKKVAELLFTYYSILFNNSYFREPTLKDLTLLFPTAEPILIQKDTNFILLPLPLPTYRQHTQAKHNDLPFRKSNPCTFIDHTPYSKECVRDMDYSVDNPFVLTARRQRVSSEWNFKNGYQHTNPALKQDRLTSTLDVTARIRVYQFQDLFPNQAETIPTFPKYSITDYSQLHVDSSRQITSQLEWYNSYAHRQYTLLEITPQSANPNSPSISELKNNLQKYSRYLIQEQLSLQRAKCFNFPTEPNTAIIQYFKDYSPAFQYSPVQIKSGIKRLKNILRYKSQHGSAAPQPSTAELCQEQTVNQPTHNQHVHSINIKQADGTFKSQLIEDMNITRRTPLDNVEPLTLSTNDNTNG